MVHKRTFRFVLVDQLHNLDGFLSLLVNVYLVDYVLNPHRSDDELLFVKSKSGALLSIVLFHVVTLSLLHVLDTIKCKEYGYGGQSRLRLQSALMRKFLNYNEQSRAKRRSTDLVISISLHAPYLVQQGYGGALLICKEVGELIFTVIYMLTAPLVFHKKVNLFMFVPMVILPLCMAAFLNLRGHVSNTLQQARNEAREDLIHDTENTASNYRLIVDYKCRNRFISRFEESIKEFNKANKLANINAVSNIYFPRWLCKGLICAWMIIGGRMVMAGTETLGMFLATIHIFAKIGRAWELIYKDILKTYSVLPTLVHITEAINMRTDLLAQKMVMDKRLEQSWTAMSDGAAHFLDNTEVVDSMPIQLGAVRFERSAPGTHGVHRVTAVNTAGLLVVRQGEFVNICGPRCGGKSSVLRLLGGAALPDFQASEDGSFVMEGVFVLPSHLRVLHVSEPIFFGATLMENLCLGCAANSRDADEARVFEILRRAACEDDLLELAADKEGHYKWEEVLSSTQRVQLSIARALIANPEVLLLHKPFELFDDEMTFTLATLLKKYVTKRGIAMKDHRDTRRPRTCVCTRQDHRYINLAHSVYHVSKEDGICEITMEHVSEQKEAAKKRMTIHERSESMQEVKEHDSRVSRMSILQRFKS